MIDRSKINEDDKWDLSSLFKNDEEYKQEVKK